VLEVQRFYCDRLAATLLFNAPIPLVLFETGTDLTCPMDESEKASHPHLALIVFHETTELETCAR
jgi:hypothetical protein